MDIKIKSIDSSQKFKYFIVLVEFFYIFVDIVYLKLSLYGK